MNFDSLVGLPYRDKGRDRAGLDCWGLVRLAFLELRGIELPAYGEDYSTAADRRAVAELVAGEIEPAWRPIAPGLEQPLDAVLVREGRFPRHVGLVTAPGKMLHVAPDHPSRIESYRAGAIAPRIVGFFRLRGA
jgi:cell wall-associated NlpC family hydrolase